MLQKVIAGKSSNHRGVLNFSEEQLAVLDLCDQVTPQMLEIRWQWTAFLCKFCDAVTWKLLRRITR